MSASRSLAWVGIVFVGVALGAALAARAGLGRVPDPRRYVRDAAGRLVEIRHATARDGRRAGSGAA
jgi:hypothetical protein